MKTLVWVEHDGSAVKDATLAAVTAASKLGEVHLLVAGSGVDGVAKAAAGIAGVGKVHVADSAAFGHNLPENIAPLVAGLMASHDAFVVPATTTGKNIAPRVAALLDVIARPAPNLPIVTRPDDLACVLPQHNGLPGVLVPHATITALQSHPFPDRAVWSGDAGALDVWLPLMAGGTVIVGAPSPQTAAA